jgi:hypothetical protein
MTPAPHRFFAMFLLLAGPFATPHPARAAQSYDNCKGFITTLPATISTQGVWCLKGDLSTAITNGYAVTVDANNVTIDCNDYKIGGLAAGESSQAAGIFVGTSQNTTVRHCNIRGFYNGIQFNSGGGHLVEDNRLDNNLNIGIFVFAPDSTIRRNKVFATGGGTAVSSPLGIEADADVIDNDVSGVFGSTTITAPYGIFVFGNGHKVSGNQVRGLVVAGGGSAHGIETLNDAVTLSGNQVANAAVAGTGILAAGGGDFCVDNTASGYATAYSGCVYATGNLPDPHVVTEPGRRSSPGRPGVADLASRLRWSDREST